MVKVIHKNLATNQNKDEQSQTVLKKMREISIEEQASTLAEKSGLPYIDLHIFPVDVEDILLIPEKEARQWNIVLFNKKNLVVRFGVLDPTNQQMQDYIEAIATKNGWQTELYVVSLPSLERAWKHYSQRTFIEIGRAHV